MYLTEFCDLGICANERMMFSILCVCVCCTCTNVHITMVVFDIPWLKLYISMKSNNMFVCFVGFFAACVNLDVSRMQCNFSKLQSII